MKASGLRLYLEHWKRSGGPRPILWIGAGASAAAGYPTRAALQGMIQQALGSSQTGWPLIEEYVASYSRAGLLNLLENQLGAPRPFTGIHESIARLASAQLPDGDRLIEAVFTTNYDDLIEDALEAQGQPFSVQTLEPNATPAVRSGLRIWKLHGGRRDWRSAVLTAADDVAFRDSYPLLRAHLGIHVRAHPVLFV